MERSPANASIFDFQPVANTFGGCVQRSRTPKHRTGSVASRSITGKRPLLAGNLPPTESKSETRDRHKWIEASRFELRGHPILLWKQTDSGTETFRGRGWVTTDLPASRPTVITSASGMPGSQLFESARVSRVRPDFTIHGAKSDLTPNNGSGRSKRGRSLNSKGNP